MGAGKITVGFLKNRLEEEMIGKLGRLTRKDLKGVKPMGAGYPKVYICSPYAGDTVKNTEAARRYCRYAIGKKLQPVASHLLYPQVLDDTDELQREMGLTFGQALLSDCSACWVFRPAGKVSEGMQKEIATALRLKIPVAYINDPKAYGEAPWDPIKAYDEKHAAENKRKPGRPRKADTEGGNSSWE